MSKSIQLKNKDNEKMYPHPYYPVGSIYLSVNDTNPSKWFGGTWEQIAKGRTLVGVDTSQTEFNTVKKTGGEKTHTLSVNEMPSHSHGTQAGGKFVNGIPTNNIGYDSSIAQYSGSGGLSVGFITNTGGSQPHNNLQPYFTCYIWCRTA